MSKPKKRKSKTPEASPIPETQKTEVVPPDLQLKWDGVTAIATAFNCLDKGYFPHTFGTVVKSSLIFISRLHENMVEEALKHPQAHMIPELKEVLAKQKGKEDVAQEATN